MAIPSVTITPVNASPQLGQTLTINSVNEFDPGDVYLAYQWKLDGNEILGATTATYTKSNITGVDAGSYTLSVMHGVDAGTATETVSNAAPITTLPATTVTIASTTTAIYVGDTLTITATPANVPAGATVGAYEWSKGGVVVSGQTTATFTKTAASGDAGSYTAKVTYTVTGQTPIKTAASNAVAVTVGAALAFTTNLSATASVVSGKTLSLTVVASGGKAPLTYLWKKGGTAIPGATNALFTITPVDSGDAGSYTCEVSDAASHKITSTACVVTITPALSYTTNLPTTKSVNAGEDLTFTVSVSGGKTPYTFTWTKDGSFIADEHLETLTVASSTPSDAGEYQAHVIDALGDALGSGKCAVTVIGSLTAKWTVHPIPWRTTSFTPLGYWVLDEILYQKALGKDWKVDYADYAYSADVQTILKAFNDNGECEVQDSRNGYIHKMSEV